MLKWFRSLFSQPEAPVQHGVYRSNRPKREPSVPRPVTETLFARPAPLPEADQVDVVAPTTEADHYQWLDYGQPGQPAVEAPEPVADTNPAAESGRWAVEAYSGNPVGVSGSWYCFTGVSPSYESFLTGYITSPKPVRRYGAISG